MERKKRYSKYIGQSLNHPQKQATHIDQIKVADHLVCKHGVFINGVDGVNIYDHHVIVSGLDYCNTIVKLTGFDGPFQDGAKVKVVTKEMNFADIKCPLYKIKYGEGEALEMGEVLRRASEVEQGYKQVEDISSDKRYSLFFNNCEHFAYYCKVGDKKSVQIENLTRTVTGIGLNAVKYGVIGKVIQDAAKTGGTAAGEVVQSTATVGLKDAVRAFTKGAKIGGVIVGSIIEVDFTAEDIYRYRQMLKKSTIDEDEFTELIIKRIPIAITSVAGAELGAITGFCVLGFVGMVLGGVIGNIFGRCVERAMGETVVFGKDVALALLERYASRNKDITDITCARVSIHRGNLGPMTSSNSLPGVHAKPDTRHITRF